MDCLFVYVARNPIIKFVRARNLREMETRFVNGYCGEILFTAQGHFEKNMSSSTSNLAVYFFHFEDRTPCSSAEGLVGMDPWEDIPLPIDTQLLKMKDNFFSSAPLNPGQLFLGENNVDEIQWSEDKVHITLSRPLLDFVVPQVPMSEEVIAHGIYTTIANLISENLVLYKVFYSKLINTPCCCFSGGGDISFINGIKSAVISTPHFSEEEPHSPLSDGESIVSGCIETKVAERSNKKILGQLVSNMTVCIAKSLEDMTAPDLQSLKVASCYGLILDYVQPIQLYKYSIQILA